MRFNPPPPPPPSPFSGHCLGNYNPINTNFHQKVTFVETLVKYGKVMQNLPKIRALLEVKIGHFVSPLFLKKMWAPYIIKIRILTAAYNIKVCVSYIYQRHYY